MKKVFIQVLLSTIMIMSLQAQEGALLLSHFKESREIEDQSWAICQDEFNVMMYANRRGIMTFDGVSWDFIRIPAVPYSIEYNKNTGKVYAGCENNYGFLEKDEKGFYRYVSLSGDSSGVGLVTQILFTDSTVFFYSDNSISRHNLLTGELEKRFEAKDNRPFTGMILTPRNVFINVLSRGLFRVEADTLFPIVTGYLLKNEEVLFSLPYDKKMVLIGLANSALSLFDGIKFYDYQIKDEGYLNQSVLSDGLSMGDSLYAFSTLDGGAIVVDRKSGKLSATINYQNGLPDDEIFAMASDNNGGLWLSHQFGLTRADLRIPIGNFNIYPGLRGNLLNAAMHNNELYVASSEGVYYLTEVKNYSEVKVKVKKEIVPVNLNIPSSVSTDLQPAQEAPKTKKRLLSRIFGKKETTEASAEKKPERKQKASEAQPKVTKPEEPQYISKTVSRLKSINHIYKKIDGLDEKCKQLLSTPSGLLASTNKGLYVISGHKAKVIVKDKYINFISKKKGENKFLIAASEGYFYVTASSGGWSVSVPDKNFDQPLWSVTSGPDKSIWAGGNSVVYKIPDKPRVSSSEYKTYSVKSSYPEKYILENVHDTLFLLAESGVYYYDKTGDSFTKYLRTESQSGSGTMYIYSQPGVLWYMDSDKWSFLADEVKVPGNKTFLLNIFEDIVSISLTGKYVWLITGDNGLYRFSRDKDLSISPDIDMYVKSVTNQDGMFFKLSDIVFRRGDNTVYFDVVAPGYVKEKSTRYQYLLEKVMSDWSKWSDATTITLLPPPGDYSMKVRARDIWGNISEPKTLKFTIKAPFTQTTFFYILILIIALVLIVLVARFRERQLRKEKSILEEKVRERTAEIQAQKEEITSSIEYASRIQRAMLPVEDLYKTYFSEHFIFFRPRDIVSGDFYWIGEDEKNLFFTVADCTGHGVPGAFMSTLGISTLNEIITNNNDLHANTILNLLRGKIKTSLHQTGKEGEAADGMDIAFCMLSKSRKTLEFSGAYNPLLIFQQGELKEHKGDRMPIGIYYGEKDTFTNHKISVSKGDTLYIFSDGMCDQFGGPEGVKYKVSNLKKLLTEINHKPMAEQRTIIENEFKKWRGSLDQVDDITLIGIRI